MVKDISVLLSHLNNYAMIMFFTWLILSCSKVLNHENCLETYYLNFRMVIYMFREKLTQIDLVPRIIRKFLMKIKLSTTQHFDSTWFDLAYLISPLKIF